MKLVWLLFGLLPMLAGCQTTLLHPAAAFRDKLPWTAKSRDTPKNLVPKQVVAIWSDALYEQPGRPSVRGFGGRVYFYNAQNETIPVEGQLVIYAYDDSERSEREERSRVPDRKFVFRPDQLESQYSPTDLGPSYNIWLPWDEIGGYKRTVALLPVFTGLQGNVAVGNQSVSILPGKSPPRTEVRRTGHFTTLGGERIAGPQDRPAGLSEISKGSAGTWRYAAPSETTQMRTTTFGLPMATTQRLIAGAGSDAAGIQTPTEGSRPAAGTPTAPPPNATTRDHDTKDPPPPARFERPRYRVPREAFERLAPVPAVSSPDPAAPRLDRPSGHERLPYHESEESVPDDFGVVPGSRPGWPLVE